MRWIVVIAVLGVLGTSAPVWAESMGSMPVQASVLAVFNVVGDGLRGSPEPVKMALLGGGLIAGALRLRRTRDEKDTGA